MAVKFLANADVADSPKQGSGNAIINGAFEINQRKFTTTSSNQTYGFDRWRNEFEGGSITYSAQTFTPASAPIAGYEAANFARVATSGQSATNHYSQIIQLNEDVRTFAGQTVTLSFFAKADSGTPSIAPEWRQNFGSGGSTQTFTPMGKVAITTSWARYSVTFTVPSMSGKTIGAGSYYGTNFWLSAGSDFNTRSSSLGLQAATIDIWGVQLESGSTVTAFRRNANTLQGELAACQRFFQRLNVNSRAMGFNFATNGALITFPFVVEMWSQGITLSVSSTASEFAVYHTNTNTNCNVVPFIWDNDVRSLTLSFPVSSGLTLGQGVAGRINGANAFIGIQAEL